MMQVLVEKKINNGIFEKQNSWIPLETFDADIKLKVNSYVVIKGTLFPIILAWACTLHKVQGLSLPKIVVGFDLHRPRNFNHVKIYVALSKVTSLEDYISLGLSVQLP